MIKIHFLNIIFVILLFSGCLEEEDLKRPYNGFIPPVMNDGWEISTPSAEGIDSASLNKIYRDLYIDDNTWMVKNLLVFRNGKLVAESYLKDEADRITPTAIWSCTKQVNSIITGIAIGQGYIESAEDPVGRYLPDYIDRHPDKKDIKVKDLLTMTSGIDFNNDTQSDVFRRHKTKNSIDYVLGLDLLHPVGSYFQYKDGDPQVISGIVQSATGMPLDEFGKIVLFDPLGISNYSWERYSDGVTMGAFGILITPRDLAKIGECVLDSGRYMGRQLIPAIWWKVMLDAKIKDANGEASFGYYWWSIPARGWYFMWGHGGQYVFLKPEKRLMVVATSLPQVDDDFSFSYEQMIKIADGIAEITN